MKEDKKDDNYWNDFKLERLKSEWYILFIVGSEQKVNDYGVLWKLSESGE